MVALTRCKSDPVLRGSNLLSRYPDTSNISICSSPGASGSTQRRAVSRGRAPRQQGVEAVTLAKAGEELQGKLWLGGNTNSTVDSKCMYAGVDNKRPSRVLGATSCSSERKLPVTWRPGRSLSPGRWELSALQRDFRMGLMELYGSLEEAFRAVSRHGRVQRALFLDAARRCEIPGHAAARLLEFHGLNRGSADYLRFLYALGGHVGPLCARPSFACGDIAEVHYRLRAGNAEHTLWETSDGQPFLALVPADVGSQAPPANAAAAAIVEPLDGNPIEGVLRVRIPTNTAQGRYEWRLFDGFSAGRIVGGGGIPCNIHSYREGCLTPSSSDFSPSLRCNVGAPETPPAPENLKAFRNAGVVTLKWDASEGSMAQTIGHCIYGARRRGEGPSAVQDTFCQAVPPGTSHTLKGLRVGTEYSFWVTSVGRLGESFPSQQVTVGPGPVKPGNAGQVEVVDVEGSWCTLRWEPPECEGGGPILQYQLRLRQAGQTLSRGSGPPLSASSTEAWCVVDTQSPLSEYVVEVPPGIPHRFQARAVNKFGSGPFGVESVWVRTGTQTPAAPGRPAAVPQKSPGECLIQWSPPPETSAAPVDGYFLHATPVGGPTDVLDLCCRFAPGSALADGVTNGRWPGGSLLETTVSGLRPGAIYTFRICAHNRYGHGNLSDSSAEVRMAAAAPGIPGTPEVLNVGARRVTLAWTVPEHDGGSLVTHYEVLADEVPLGGGNSSGSTRHATIGDITRLTIPVRAAAICSFRVIAVNAVGKSSPSGVAEVQTPEGLPSAPAQLEVDKHTDGSAVLSWEAPADNGGRSIEKYEVLIFLSTCAAKKNTAKIDAGELELIRIEDTGSPSTRHRMVQLQGGATHFFQVRAVSAFGQGECSALSAPFEVPSQRPGVPGTPICAEVAARSVSLRWPPPQDDGGSPVLQYIVVVSEESLGGNSFIADSGVMQAVREWEEKTFGSQPIHVVNGLKPGTRYTFHTIAISAVGVSTPSNPSQIVRTHLEIPGPPSFPEVISVTDISADIVFTPPEEGEVTEYRCFATIEGGNQERVVPMRELASQAAKDGFITARILDLDPCQVYRLAVQARNDAGWGPLGGRSLVVETLVGVASAPGRPEVTEIHGDSVRLLWEGPRDSRGGSISQYIVFVRSFASGTEEERVVGAEEGLTVLGLNQSVFIRGLQPTTLYTFRVAAVNEAGRGSISEESSEIRTASVVPSRPGRPISSSLRPGSDVALPGSLWISWGVPEDDGGSPLLGYRVLIMRLKEDVESPDSADEEREDQDNGDVLEIGVQDFPTSPGQPCEVREITDLQPGALYAFRVQAMGKAGASMLSARSHAHYAPDLGTPSHCLDFALLTVDAEAAQIKWWPPADHGVEPIVGYQITIASRSHRGGPWDRDVVKEVELSKLEVRQDGALTYHVSDLHPGTEYRMGVCAISAAGVGDPLLEEQTMLTPPPNAPAAWQRFRHTAWSPLQDLVTMTGTDHMNEDKEASLSPRASGRLSRTSSSVSSNRGSQKLRSPPGSRRLRKGLSRLDSNIAFAEQTIEQITTTETDILCETVTYEDAEMEQSPAQRVTFEEQNTTMQSSSALQTSSLSTTVSSPGLGDWTSPSSILKARSKSAYEEIERFQEGRVRANKTM